MRRWAVGGVALAQLVALAWGSWLLAGTSDVVVKVFQFRPGRPDPLAEAIVKQFPERYRG